VFLQLISIAWWIYYLLITKPKFNNGSNRFMKNYNEGGFFILLATIVWSIVLSVVASLVVLLLNFLER
jgi:hypothetical protein